MAKRKKKRKNKIKKVPNTTESVILQPPQKTTITAQKPERTYRLFSSLKKIGPWIVAFLTLLGALSIYSFYPRVSIQETTLLNPSDPFYYPFMIKNTGNIRVIDFSYVLKITKVITYSNNFALNSAVNNADTIATVKVNGSHPINLSHSIDAPAGSVKEAQIFIRYKYSIPIFWKPFTDSAKFVLFKDYFNAYKWKEYQY